MRNFLNKIEVNPKILGNKPIIRGTRISVEFILELLDSKMTPQEIAQEYPQLTLTDVYAAISYATGIVKQEEILIPKFTD
ncbi:DUF433 domain-containing protein [Patescibacteria group bacterium]|nr:DUF433 domain-containing protein [Patescibacteria group bacterium]MBU4512854.1 DUF433 domain-containing protein [Patescibacteria group bacterium]MCG2693629.1 DUF433 domain-containing protein [Candidatus Parcubacteria bacterium]